MSAPLDPYDPRFGPTDGAGDHERRLVRSSGPGPDPENPRSRILRWALPLLFTSAALVVGAVFFTSLQPGPQVEVVGAESAIRAAVAERPKRVCFHDNNPCAWLTVVRGRLVAFNTNGPLPQEYGRDGVGWCSSSGWFGANATGSRFDQEGRVAGGPAPRGLDRYGLRVDDAGMVTVVFTELTSGALAGQVTQVTPPAGPHCGQIPFDRDADLDLPAPAG